MWHFMLEYIILMMFRVTNRQTFIRIHKKMFIFDTTGNE